MKFQTDMLTLYAVTDRTWLGGRTLAEVVEQAIRGGATMVQLREKDKTSDEILASAREIAPVCRKYGVPFIMNDSIELARQAGADGVHLGQSDVPDGDVRRMAEGLILGMSANTVESAKRAEALGADYLGVGAVFGTTTKHDARHLSPEKLREITASVSIPVVAIGGISADNILELTGCGMQGAAVVSALFAQDDPLQAARDLRGKAECMKQSGMTARLLASSVDLWQAYYDHPFVQGIQNGTLDHEKFRFYTIQDYLYLLDYAKVFAVGMSRADDPAVMHTFSQYISQIMDCEMNVHEGYMGTFGITKDELRAAQPSLANRSYTSYMLACAQAGGPAEALTAILACAVSYEHIAKEMVRRQPDCISDPFYGAWVASYASEQYAEENRVLCGMVDRLTANYTETQCAKLIDIFRTCARYEKAFWDMSWNLEL